MIPFGIIGGRRPFSLCSRRAFLVVLTLAVVSSAHRGMAETRPYQLDCDHGKGITQITSLRGLIAKLTPDNGSCRLTISSDKGDVLFSYRSEGIQLSHPLELDSDDQKFVLVQLDAQPYKLVVLRLGSRPQIVATLDNAYGFWIQNDCADGRSHIWTADGGFEGDKELINIYHHDLLSPDVVLSIRGDSLVDVTSHCRAYFDKKVSAFVLRLNSKQVGDFRDGKIVDEFRSEEVKGAILYIALTDLYTGRVSASKLVLFKMWPPADQDRIWNWMLEKRSTGILAKLR